MPAAITLTNRKAKPRRHQMSFNGKREHFTRVDLMMVGDSIDLPRPADIIGEVADAVTR